MIIAVYVYLEGKFKCYGFEMGFYGMDRAQFKFYIRYTITFNNEGMQEVYGENNMQYRFI